MKQILHIVLLFLIITITVKADKIEAVMDGRSLVVRVKDVLANCGSKFDDKIEIITKKIVITQIDTSTFKQRCECNFDLIHTIGNLLPGKYKIEIFREEFKQYGYPEDKRYLIGTIDFDIPNLGQKSGLTLDFRQTPCKATTKLNFSPTSKSIGLEIFPNPGKDEISIRFNSNSSSSARFVIYNLSGKEIYSKEFKNLDDGVFVGKINLQQIPEGVYIAKLLMDNGNSETKKLIWSK